MAPAQYSVWLLAKADQELLLTQRVKELSKRLGGVPFQPHVTIQGDIAMPRVPLRAALRAIAASFPVQRWPVRAVERSDFFFRSLYLRFDATPAFASMQEALQQLTGTARGLSPFPHLSLVYCQRHPETEGLCRDLQQELGNENIVFDRLVVARSSKNVLIADWQCLAQFPLVPADAIKTSPCNP